MAESSPETPDTTPAALPQSTAAPRSIGERLRAGRDRTGLSVLAAAEKLHLDPKVIEALEGERFAELGASVYVRGHLKRYAEFVNENAVELLNLYGARESRPIPPDLTQVPHADRRADPRRLVTPLVVIGSAGALVAAIWWVLSGSQSGQPPPAAAVPPTQLVPADGAPVAGPSVAVAAAPASLTSSAALPATASQPVADSRPGTAAAVEDTASPAPPVAAPPAREIQLRLELATESWVEIYDSRGERLFFDVAGAGTVQSITGRGPMRVFLGNAAGVSVEVDGQARDIPESAIDGDGARFVVNRSGTLTRAR